MHYISTGDRKLHFTGLQAEEAAVIAASMPLAGLYKKNVRRDRVTEKENMMSCAREVCA